MLDKLWKFLTGSSDEKTTATAGKNGSEQSRAAAPVSRAPGPWRVDQATQQQQQLRPSQQWAPALGDRLQPPTLSPARSGVYNQSPRATLNQPSSQGVLVDAVQAQKKQKQDTVDNDRLAREYDNKLTGNGAPVEIEEMSWDDYSALTPRQRAAVDLNSELLEAVNADKADKNAQITPEYTQLSEKLFGKDRGSDTVAPRTVALLNELNGVKPQSAPQDLDQYLGLHALIGADDLRFLTDEGVKETARSGQGLGKNLALAPSTRSDEEHEPQAASDAGNYLSPDRYSTVDPRAENAVRLATAAQARLSQSLVAGQTLIGKLRTDSDLGARLFGDPTTSVGFNPALERDQALQSIFDTMARKDATFADGELAEALGTFNEEFGLDNDQLLQFFETRLKASEYGNSPVGTDSTGQYLNPAEFRARYYNGDN